jgi:hypothetical protein
VAAGVLLALALVIAGCSTSDDSLTGGKGYISGAGVVTTIEPADRPDAPRLDGDKLGGGTIDTDDYAGQIMVLNVWDVAFVGLNVRDTDSSAEAYVRAKKIPYPSLVSEDGAVLLKFYDLLNVNSLPSTVVVDSDGRVAALVLGEVTAATLSGIIEDVQKEA